MSHTIDIGKALILAMLASLLWANVSFANEAAKKAEPAGEDGVENTDSAYPITRPASRNALSAEILEKMRTNLMTVMGVEPEDTEGENTKKPAGH
jgi:hypothetical protein